MAGSTYQHDEEAALGTFPRPAKAERFDEPRPRRTILAAVAAVVALLVVVLLFRSASAPTAAGALKQSADAPAAPAPTPDPHEPFGNMAARLATAAYTQLTTNLYTLQQESDPEEIHAVRKSILDLRNVLDVFADAFFPASDGKDTWHILRRDLAHGYVMLGELQDQISNEGEYTTDELEEQRTNCLDWKAKFEAMCEKRNCKSYLSQPSGSRLYRGGHRHYSNFFWGNEADSPRPKETASGLGNVCMLLSYMLDMAEEKYTEAMKVNNHEKIEKYHDTFHDFRKAIRGINSVVDTVPESMLPGAKKDKRLAMQVYKKFGRVNDEYGSWAAATHDNNRDDAKECEEQLDEDLKNLHDWCDRKDVAGMPERLRQQLAEKPGSA